MILFARSLSFAFGFVGQVEDLQMSSSAVDIAWISCGRGLELGPSPYRDKARN
jgi:hypothetical protein